MQSSERLGLTGIAVIGLVVLAALIILVAGMSGLIVVGLLLTAAAGALLLGLCRGGDGGVA